MLPYVIWYMIQFKISFNGLLCTHCPRLCRGAIHFHNYRIISFVLKHFSGWFNRQQWALAAVLVPQLNDRPSTFSAKNSINCSCAGEHAVRMYKLCMSSAYKQKCHESCSYSFICWKRQFYLFKWRPVCVCVCVPERGTISAIRPEYCSSISQELN